jgi:hypothetical protein
MRPSRPKPRQITPLEKIQMDVQKTEYGVFVKIGDESRDGYQGKVRTTAWVDAYPIVMNYKWRQADDPSWRYCGTLAGEEYEHIVLRAMLADDSTEQTVGSGDLTGRDIYSVHVHEVRRLLKSMEAIQRKLSKMYETEGSALSFGQLVLRFMKAIGAQTLVLERSKESRQMCGERWEQIKRGEVVHRVDYLIKEWRKSKTGETEQELAF